MTKFIATLLLIPLCSLAVGVANAADRADKSMRIAPAGTPAPAVAPVPLTIPLLRQMRPDTHVSHAGIGALYWAAHHSAQAWRVLLPIRPRDGSGASEDLRELCAFARPPGGRAACP
jgi:hypothetical protein